MAKKPITRRKPLRGSAYNLPDLTTIRKPNLPPLSNGFGNGLTTDNSMLTHMHKESQEVQDEIERKRSRTAPLFNKGGYMYIGDGDDLTKITGKK
jgi:hypothetical protein